MRGSETPAILAYDTSARQTCQSPFCLISVETMEPFSLYIIYRKITNTILRSRGKSLYVLIVFVIICYNNDGMDVKQVLIKSLDESQEYLTKALHELSEEDITWSPKVGSNSIIFILWHLALVEDIWINRRLLKSKEIYESEGWQEKLGTPVKESGPQYTTEELQSWPVPQVDILQRYAAAVRQNTVAFISSLDVGRLSEVAPPDHKYGTVEAILSHLITEIALHVGQIDYLRGMIQELQPQTH